MARAAYGSESGGAYFECVCLSVCGNVRVGWSTLKANVVCVHDVIG
jgi:hypothetical protein